MLWEAVAVTVAKAIKKYAYNARVISMGYSAHGGKWQKFLVLRNVIVYIQNRNWRPTGKNLLIIHKNLRNAISVQLRNGCSLLLNWPAC